jgi:chemotaxis protein methyltransferase CheR
MTDLNQSGGTSDVMALSPKGFDRLARFVTDELGIKMPSSKISMIQGRLMRRVKVLGLRSIEEYGDYLFAEGKKEERDHFINAITTNKTDFFREPEHFKYLTQVALPSLQTNAGFDPTRMRAWSAACSSGEEPYTLAMVLNQYSRRLPQFDFEILATDVSTKVLQAAQRGIYAEDLIEPVPLDMRRRYLLLNKNPATREVRIVPTLRQKVSFHRLNFMDANYGIKERFDIIFLRNVLIYFERPIQEVVVNRVCSHLKPGGYLFISHSESLSELNVPVKRVHAAIYRSPI